MTFSERSNFTLFRPTTARKLGPAVTMATAEPLDHAESLERAWKSEWLARDTPGGLGVGWGWGWGGVARERPRAVSAQVNRDGMWLDCRARGCVWAIALEPREQPLTVLKV